MYQARIELYSYVFHMSQYFKTDKQNSVIYAKNLNC